MQWKLWLSFLYYWDVYLSEMAPWRRRKNVGRDLILSFGNWLGGWFVVNYCDCFIWVAGGEGLKLVWVQWTTLLSRPLLSPNKAATEPLCISEQHSGIVLNESAFLLNKWLNPFIKAVSWFILEWISHLNGSVEWMIQWLLKTVSCHHLLAVLFKQIYAFTVLNTIFKTLIS